MASLDSIQAALERAEREQKVRDEGLLRAFNILCGAIERNQITMDLIHQGVTEIKNHLTALLEDSDDDTAQD